MSWADDVRCLYCDGRLPLYRKITNGQFCSSGHRKAYWQEQERLAVERLQQTHQSLKPHQPSTESEILRGLSPTRTVPAPHALAPHSPAPHYKVWSSVPAPVPAALLAEPYDSNRT